MCQNSTDYKTGILKRPIMRRNDEKNERYSVGHLEKTENVECTSCFSYRADRNN